MTPTIYKLIGDFPKCRICGHTMDYWDLRPDWSTYEHDKCRLERMCEEIRVEIRKIFEEVK